MVWTAFTRVYVLAYDDHQLSKFRGAWDIPIAHRVYSSEQLFGVEGDRYVIFKLPGWSLNLRYDEYRSMKTILEVMRERKVLVIDVSDQLMRRNDSPAKKEFPGASNG